MEIQYGLEGQGRFPEEVGVQGDITWEKSERLGVGEGEQKEETFLEERTE